MEHYLEDESLWRAFNLADRTLDQGGGILYALRYPPEQIELKRQAVRRALESKGVEMKEQGEGIAVFLPKEPETLSTLMLLLEELSVLNEATEYQDGGLNAKSITELENIFLGTMYQLLLKKDLVSAYELIEFSMGQVSYDLQKAQESNQVFTGKRKKEFKSFVETQKRKADQLNRGDITIFGTK